MENAVEQWSVLLLEDFRSASPLLASAAPAIYMAALTTGRLLAHARAAGVGALAWIAALGGAAGMGLAGLSSHAWGSLAGFALAGLALGPIVPAMLSRAAAGDPGGSTVAAISTVSYTGFVISPCSLAGWPPSPGCRSPSPRWACWLCR